MPTSLLEAVAERLIPLFLIPGVEPEAARTAALETIRAYNPQSHADYANIGRILAFSLAAITAIGKSADPSLPPNVQLRYLGKANTLGRSATQAERTLAQRHKPAAARPKAEAAKPQPETPKPAAPVPRPSTIPNLPVDPEVLADVAASMAEFTGLLAEPPNAERWAPAYAAKKPTGASLKHALLAQTSLAVPAARL